MSKVEKISAVEALMASMLSAVRSDVAVLPKSRVERRSGKEADNSLKVSAVVADVVGNHSAAITEAVKADLLAAV